MFYTKSSHPPPPLRILFAKKIGGIGGTHTHPLQKVIQGHGMIKFYYQIGEKESPQRGNQTKSISKEEREERGERGGKELEKDIENKGSRNRGEEGANQIERKRAL